MANTQKSRKVQVSSTTKRERGSVKRKSQSSENPDRASSGGNKTLRVGELLRVLFNHQIVYKKDLPDLLGVSVRTVNRYIENLRLMDIPLIEEIGVNGGTLRLQQGGAKHLTLSMHEHEAVALNVALQMLGVFEGEYMHSSLVALRERIARQLRTADKIHEATIHDEWVRQRFLPLSFLPRKQATDNKGGGLFLQVVTALWDEAKLKFNYCSHGKTTRKSVFPYTLVFYKGAFYLMCSHREEGKVVVYALSRMSEAEVQQEKLATLPRDYNPRDHFGELSGMLPGEEVEVEAKFDPDLYEYLNAREWGAGALLEQREGHLYFKCTINANEELAKWFIGFGAKAEVVSPPSFRAKVVELVRESMSVYGLCDTDVSPR